MARDDQLYYIACGWRMKQSTGQQLKMVPFGDQQPFPLQLGKLHRHGGTLHAEKIRQLLTVKGNVKEVIATLMHLHPGHSQTGIKPISRFERKDKVHTPQLLSLIHI